jgi:hypothetical protein
MKSSIRSLLIAAVLLTVGVLFVWQFTGGDYYTKFEVVEEVEEKLDPSDPLADAGFYENNTATKTISRKEFRLGLLPVPQGIFDKHAVSVLTILFLIWGLAASSIWFIRRQTARVLINK